MKVKIKILLLLNVILALFSACRQEENRSDAYGNFEAVSTIVSSEANGRLLYLNVEEGQKLEAGDLIALVDTTSLHLQKLQLIAKRGTLPKKLRTAEPDIAVLQDQKKNLIRERDRVAKLLEDKAATPKQLDDLNGELEVVEQRIGAVRKQVEVANRGILAEQSPIDAQITSLEDQIRKCYIYNPVKGTVLTKLAEAMEIVRFGSPIYKIADLEYLSLRVYASAVQISEVAVGQKVKVYIDGPDGSLEELEGKVTWIAEDAEFTPKTIQTKEERVNLVYALKVSVANGGKLKIGMPGEVVFRERSKEQES